MGSITEVVQTVKGPKCISRAMNDETATKHEEQEKFNFDFVLPKSAEVGSTSTLNRQTSPQNFESDISRLSSYQDRSKASRKSGRISLKGYLFSLNFNQNSALVSIMLN